MRLLLTTLLAVSALADAQAASLALVGAKVYPSPDAAPVENATVLIRDGVITRIGADVAVPAGVEVIDARGDVVVAGFWNSHVHLLPEPYRGAATKPANLLSDVLASHFTQWGFTTVFDIASLPGDALALRRRIESGEIDGPQILTVDAPFFPEGGTPIYVRALLEQVKAPPFEVKHADEAARRTARQLGAGADGAKLFAGAIVGGGIGVLPMKPEIARAVVTEAHRHGKPAFAHPTNLEGVQLAIDSGVDVLAHTTTDGVPWPAPLVATVASKRMALIPTLMLIEVESKAERLPDAVRDRMLAAASQQVDGLAGAGGQLLFGTDSGYIDVFDPLREYQLMAAAGLDWRQVLASLTTAPSTRFGQAARNGRVATGMDADLVVLDGDPADDVAALNRVRLTIRGGRVIHRAAEAGSEAGADTSP